jgi:hypothetical protein
MRAVAVTDQTAGTAGMTLVERPEPPAALNDVIVQIYASGFVPTEIAWPSTWTDRRDRDRTPSIPAMNWPEWSPPSATEQRGSRWDSDGPYYTSLVRVIGPDVLALDRDGDDWGCE